MKRIALVSFLLFAMGHFLNAQPVVAVSIPPQKFVFDAVAGQDAPPCLVMIDRGQDPHVFEPTPQQLLALQGCELYFKVGLPFEDVLVEKLVKINPKLRVVGVATDFDVDEEHHDQARGHHGHGHAEDPHCWMSPDWLVMLSREMAIELSRRTPEAADGIAARQKIFAEQALALKQELATRLKASGVKHVLVYHPAWGHFAEAFGLEQVAVEAHGQTPGARHLAAVSATIREHGLKTIFVQNVSEQRRIASFAKRHGVKTVEVYPLAEDVFETLKATVGPLVSGQGSAAEAARTER